MTLPTERLQEIRQQCLDIGMDAMVFDLIVDKMPEDDIENAAVLEASALTALRISAGIYNRAVGDCINILDRRGGLNDAALSGLEALKRDISDLYPDS